MTMSMGSSKQEMDDDEIKKNRENIKKEEEPLAQIKDEQ